MNIQLIFHPNPILKEASKKIDDVSSVQKMCSDMIETMEKEKGIGLSAIQVGKKLRISTIHKDADKSLEEHLVMLNPKIFSASPDMEKGEEGCLSIPGIFGIVERSKKIKVRFTDINGQEQKIKATGLFARVIQHELDHLDGILFLDRTDSITKGF